MEVEPMIYVFMIYVYDFLVFVNIVLVVCWILFALGMVAWCARWAIREVTCYLKKLLKK